ncbi:CHAT domain-containing protein [Dolichospermum flos-aquae]|jgi:DNA replication protein DnaC|uniref:CHAT domain-containing protein n=1 Tax=Dolichospermum flosaquae TaxID=1166 RepID=UPI001F2B9780|nr:CHAT domain-containing protein [Dolichospermum flos-aquae]
MPILHIDLRKIDNNYVELRYFRDNPNQYDSRQVSLNEIQQQINLINRDYYEDYNIQPEDYARIGQVLYNFLDGSERFLQKAIDEYSRDGLVLAIATSEELAHLPWEILHDGKKFLVEKKPGIILPLRWNPDKSNPLEEQNQPKNSALNVLFMATSPIDSNLPELDFEEEEARILKATSGKPLSLIVEESGCLEEMHSLIETYYQRNYFDVFHLTGHTGEKDGNTYFITETELGEKKYSSAEDIAEALGFPMPKLIFLCGCQTGYSPRKGTVQSMAEALLMEGANAVLGWGKKVSDKDATEAAANLYEKLSGGYTVIEAIATTYRTLIKNKATGWHLLRFYVAKTLPGQLVERGQESIPRNSFTTEFFDSEGKVRVANRESFIGRRRQLQNCLRSLKISSSEIGVLIHGMGGLGKSTIAARLCDRLSGHKKIVWWRQIDEPSLVKKLADHLQSQEQRTLLRGNQEELKQRLKRAFNTLGRSVLVFDDFEWNLKPRDQGYVLNPDAAEVLSALIWAIRNQENITHHRIIITSRYDFEF